MRQLARKEPLKHVRLERAALGDRSGPLGMIAALGDMVEGVADVIAVARLAARHRTGRDPIMKTDPIFARRPTGQWVLRP